MTVIERPTKVSGVDEDSGRQITDRRERLGMSTKALAAEAKVDRGTLAKIEAGDPSVRSASVGAILATLDKLEYAMGVAPTGEAVEPLRFTFHDIYGIGEFIAEGPADNPDALIAAVSRMLKEIRER